MKSVCCSPYFLWENTRSKTEKHTKNNCNNKKQKSDFVKIEESKLQKNSKLFKERLLLIISSTYNNPNAANRTKIKTFLNSC